MLNAVLNICNSTGVSKRDLLLCDILLLHLIFVLLFAFSFFCFLEISMTVIDLRGLICVHLLLLLFHILSNTAY